MAMAGGQNIVLSMFSTAAPIEYRLWICGKTLLQFVLLLMFVELTKKQAPCSLHIQDQKNWKFPKNQTTWETGSDWSLKLPQCKSWDQHCSSTISVLGCRVYIWQWGKCMKRQPSSIRYLPDVFDYNSLSPWPEWLAMLDSPAFPEDSWLGCNHCILFKWLHSDPPCERLSAMFWWKKLNQRKSPPEPSPTGWRVFCRIS